MEPYETEKPSAKELLTAYVIEYGKINATNDVTLIDIVQPSTNLNYSRINPLGGLPLIRVKNNGSKPLKKMNITYFIVGEKVNTYKWSGNVSFGETAMITLPTEIFSTKESAKFRVELSRPNGDRDAFVSDNKMESEYIRPNIFPEKIIVYYKTNKKPKQNWGSIKNSFGEVLFEKDEE